MCVGASRDRQVVRLAPRDAEPPGHRGGGILRRRARPPTRHARPRRSVSSSTAGSTAGRPADHDHVLAAGLAEVDVAQRCPRTIVSYSLVSSRATATGRSGPHAAARSAIVRGDAVGRLVEHHRAPLGGDLGEALGAARPPCGAGTPRTRTGSVGRPLDTSAATNAAGPGHGRRPSKPGVERGAHQPLARVADPRRAGVGHHRHVAAVGQRGEHVGDPRRARCGRWRRRAARRAMPAWAAAARCAGCPRSRRGRPMPAALDGPRRQVAEVADRGGHEHETAAAGTGRRVARTRSRLRRRRAARRRRRRDSPHRSNAPGDASITQDACFTGIPIRRRFIRTILITTPSPSTNATSIGMRMPIVCTHRQDGMTNAPSSPSRPSRPLRRCRDVVGDVGRGQDPGFADQPRHAREHGTRSRSAATPAG